MASNDTERSTGDVGLRLTYAEIAARLGISGDAARQLVRRRGWLRIVPNRRGATTTVIVPEGELAGEQWRDTRSTNNGGTTPDDNRHELRTALTLVDRLSVQLGEAHARADQAIERADKAEARAARAEAATGEERAKADALRVQIDVLNAEMVSDRAEAESAIADERQRADRMSERVDALNAEIRQAEARAEGTDADRRAAEARVEAERARADALRTTIDELKAAQALADSALRQAEAMVDSLREAHAGEVGALKAERHRLATQIDGFATRADQAEARTDSLRARADVLQRERDTAHAVSQAAAVELRGVEAERRARGLLARLRAKWRRE
jgi:chromosome segregation ATPase